MFSQSSSPAKRNPVQIGSAVALPTAILRFNLSNQKLISAVRNWSRRVIALAFFRMLSGALNSFVQRLPPGAYTRNDDNAMDHQFEGAFTNLDKGGLFSALYIVWNSVYACTIHGHYTCDTFVYTAQMYASCKLINRSPHRANVCIVHTKQTGAHIAQMFASCTLINRSPHRANVCIVHTK